MLHDHRRIIGQPKTITIKHMQGRWWCIVTAESFEQDWFGYDAKTLKEVLAADPRPDAGVREEVRPEVQRITQRRQKALVHLGSAAARPSISEPLAALLLGRPHAPTSPAIPAACFL